MNVRRFLSKLKASYYIVTAKSRASFAQVGEDSILYFLFNSVGINKISYLDIGANSPVVGNNTYAFYLSGSRGVCIEPDPTLFKKLKSVRKKDTCLNMGIGFNEESAADFYIFKTTGWNTFSKEEAELRRASGAQYEKVIQVPLKNINTIIPQYFTTAPDLISIDVEGLDLDILQSLDFGKFSPKVLLVETLRFGATDKAEKQQAIIDLILSKGYFIYADTYVNTIFCKNNFFTK
ncbi:MAG: FkbM family methyltransferase [Bacteroidetes bacterium]|nr:FkbM family methyltransferase [Bacteroidota bacterium]MBS1756522.1 FkbM family methyltransferase [Bacteroidota bacterium]